MTCNKPFFQTVPGYPLQIAVRMDKFVLPMYYWADYLDGTFADITFVETGDSGVLFEFTMLADLITFIEGCNNNMTITEGD